MRSRGISIVNALSYSPYRALMELATSAPRGGLTSMPVCVSECLTIGSFWITSLPLVFSVIIPKEVARACALVRQPELL